MKKIPDYRKRDSRVALQFAEKVQFRKSDTDETLETDETPY